MSGLTWKELRAVRLLDRYEAAIRLEQIRQQIRECCRFGFPVTLVHQAELQAAERQYTSATASVR